MKRQRNLLQLMDDLQCESASKEAFRNAAKHRELAVLAASAAQYGSGTSLLILSSEETVKGFILFLQSKGLNLRNIKGMHLFFTDHIIKHQLATFITLLSGMIRPFVGLALKMRDRLHEPEKEIVYTPRERALLSRNKFTIAREFASLGEMFDWWEDANMMKNKGLYVDYSTSLETPMQVTETEFASAEKLINAFESEIREVVDYLNNLTAEMLESFVRLAREHNYSEHFSSLIAGRQKQLRNK